MNDLAISEPYKTMERNNLREKTHPNVILAYTFVSAAMNINYGFICLLVTPLVNFEHSPNADSAPSFAFKIVKVAAAPMPHGE